MGRTIGMLGAVAMLFAASGARADLLGFAGSVTWFGQVPIMVAIDKGFFKEQGLDIEYQVILNSSRSPGLGGCRLVGVQQSRPQFDHPSDGARRHQLLLLRQLR